MWYTKEEATKKYPGVEFLGDGWVGRGGRAGYGAKVGPGVKIDKERYCKIRQIFYLMLRGKK